MLNGIGNHLWQSTVFAALAVLLAALLRENCAQVRYRLWLAASLKFLLPFSLLLVLGDRIEWRSAAAWTPPVAAAMERANQPFSIPPVEQPAVQLASSAIVPGVLLAVWLAGFLVVAARWCARWRRVRLALRGATPLPLHGPVAVMSSPGRLEPGVFGIFGPVLVLPAGIADRLTPEQMEAVLAHEFCHVRRRDNLFGALHMVVEALFWFHPAVWFLGARLVEERERACDEEVLRAGADPEQYAAGILKVCKFYLESPLPCAAGVTGADLKQRVQGIMTRRRQARLTVARKALLAAVALAATGGPLLVGVVRQAQAQGLRFEVASIKRSKSDTMKYGFNILPGGGLKMDGITLKGLIAFAYDVMEERVSGGPSWMHSEVYDIVAKAEKADPAVTNDQATMAAPGSPVWNRVRLRTQQLLKERFQLVVRTESKETSGYELVVAKGGSKLKETTAVNPPGTMRGRGRIDGRAGSMGMLAAVLGNYLGHPVADRTGLAGNYDYALRYAQDASEGLGETAVEAPGPSVLAALEEQLGLKLQKAKVEIRTIVVDRAERASEN